MSPIHQEIREHLNRLIEGRAVTEKVKRKVIALIWRIVEGQYQVLLVRSAFPPYTSKLPQGTVEGEGGQYEDVLVALFREIKEETGLVEADFSDPSFLGYEVRRIDETDVPEGQWKIRAFLACFSLEYRGAGEVVLNHENTRFEWVALHEALEMLERETYLREGRRVHKPGVCKNIEFIKKFRQGVLF